MPADTPDAILTLDSIRKAVDAARDLLNLWCRDAHKKERLPWPKAQMCEYEDGKYSVELAWDGFQISVLGPTEYEWQTTVTRPSLVNPGEFGTSLLDGLPLLRAMLREAK